MKGSELLYLFDRKRIYEISVDSLTREFPGFCLLLTVDYLKIERFDIIEIYPLNKYRIRIASTNKELD